MKAANKDSTKEFIDNMIKTWREVKKGFKKRSTMELGAKCYIDAYQTVRLEIYGEKLTEEEERKRASNIMFKTVKLGKRDIERMGAKF